MTLTWHAITIIITWFVLLFCFDSFLVIKVSCICGKVKKLLGLKQSAVIVGSWREFQAIWPATKKSWWPQVLSRKLLWHCRRYSSARLAIHTFWTLDTGVIRAVKVRGTSAIVVWIAPMLTSALSALISALFQHPAITRLTIRSFFSRMCQCFFGN